MASGWWKSTTENLAAGSPADFEVTTSLEAPRGFPKLASIATGAGLYLAGKPYVVVDDVLYYACDNYTQDTERPPLLRYDGRAVADVSVVPYITGTTPAKAILSLAADDDGNIYISTWDAGATATTFSGRVLKFAEGTMTQFGDDVFTGGRLPYQMLVHDDKLWVISNRQDPTKLGSVYTIDLDDETTAVDHSFMTGGIDPPTTSVTRTTTTYSYQVTVIANDGTESAPTSAVTCTNVPTLDSTSKNTISWTAPTAQAVTDPSSAPTASASSGTSTRWWAYVYVAAGPSGTGIGGSSYHTAHSPSLQRSASSTSITIACPYSTDPDVTHIIFMNATTNGGNMRTWLDRCVFANNTAGGTCTASINLTGAGLPSVDPFPNTNTISDKNAFSYRVYRTSGHTSTGVIANTFSTSFVDDGDAGTGTAVPNGSTVIYPATNPVCTATDPTTATSYAVTALNANGETDRLNIATVQASATLTSTNKTTITWTAVTGATGYNVYRTAGHTTTGKIVSNTSALTADDTGLAGNGASVPVENTTGTAIGAPSCFEVYNDAIYVGLYQPAATFASVWKRASDGTWTNSNTVAPGGTAQAYNGFTAMIVFESNLYAAYWNDDATDITLIRKYNGSAWSTVATISGAGARPIMCFVEADGMCYAYGGGDAKTGILYESADGSSWTDVTSLLPSAKEAIPFVAKVYVIGGF